jgi:hypothetical protein
MTNKKLFWIAFFTLSLFEFGQFAYSKNLPATAQKAQLNGEVLLCNELQTSNRDLITQRKFISYALPR